MQALEHQAIRDEELQVLEERIQGSELRALQQRATSSKELQKLEQQAARIEELRFLPSKSELPQVVKLNELVRIPEKFEGSRQKARKWLDGYECAAISNS